MSITVVFFILLTIMLGAFAWFRSYIKKHTGGAALLEEINEEVNRLLLRIDETTNRDITLIEERERQLKNILLETERKIYILREEFGELNKKEKEREVKIAEEKLKAENNTAEKAEEVLVFPFAKEKKETPVPVPQPVSVKIRELANSGFTAEVIASKLGISISEAELALALINRK